MSNPTYGVALSTAGGAAVCLYEGFHHAHELYAGGVPHSFLGLAFNVVAVVAGLYAVSELRQHLLTLRQRPILGKLGDIGFWVTVAGVVVFYVYSIFFAAASLTTVLLMFACCVPMIIFGSMRELGESSEAPDLFEYADRKSYELSAIADADFREREHEAFLKQFPDQARLERMPMIVKIRSGMMA
jgi:hypothetical protein